MAVCVGGLLSFGTADSAEVLKIGGTGSSLGSIRLLGAAFEKLNPSVKVEVMPSIGSNGAIRAVAKGALDIGISGRPLHVQELAFGLTAAEYAKTPFIPVTHRDVGVSGITTEELVKVYNGEMKTWPDGGMVRLILRLTTETDNLLVRKISPEMNRAMDRAMSRPGMLIAHTDQENGAIIEQTLGAVGFSTLAQVTSEHLGVRILSLDGVVPGLQSLEAGRYRLSKSFSLVTKIGGSPFVRKFIDFMKSPEGRQILRETGNLPAR